MAYKRKAASKYRTGKRARKAAYRGRKKWSGRTPMKRMIKKTIMAMAEPKHTAFDHGKYELYHNSGSAAAGRVLPTAIELYWPLRMPLQGSGDQQRIGDQINVKGFAVHCLLGQKQDRMNVTFRIIVLKCTEDQEPPNLNDLIENVTGNILLDSTNKDRGSIVYQKFIKKNVTPQLEAAGQQRELTYTHKFWIPVNKRIKFSANNGQTFSGDKLYMYFFSYDAYGSLVTDNIAYVQVWSKLYYCDP